MDNNQPERVHGEGESPSTNEAPQELNVVANDVEQPVLNSQRSRGSPNMEREEQSCADQLVQDEPQQEQPQYRILHSQSFEVQQNMNQSSQASIFIGTLKSTRNIQERDLKYVSVGKLLVLK